MNRYIKIKLISVITLCISSCLGIDEAELIRNYIPPQVICEDVKITADNARITLEGVINNETKSSVKECGFYYIRQNSTLQKVVCPYSPEKFATEIHLADYGSYYTYKAYISNGKSEISSEYKTFYLPAYSYYTTIGYPKVLSSADGTALIVSSLKVAKYLPISEKGVIYSTDRELAHGTKVISTATDGISVEINNLSAGKEYYIRSYVTDGSHTAYSNVVVFVNNAKPTVTTSSPTDVTSSSATSGGNVTSDGGKDVTARGVVWSTDHHPTISLSTKTTDGTGTGSFVSSITDLEPGTTYYVRAYATNSQGTSYGDEVSFTTKAVKPSVTTSEATDVTKSSATVGGNVTATGGADVTERGVVWSTSKNPTVDGNKKQSGSGSGSFTVELTDLDVATTYYVRAYATNSVGTSYGEEISFTTGSVKPTVTTSSPTDVTSSSATSGGNVTSDGGKDVTARGVVWSTDHNPTISLSTKTTDGTGTGSFVSSITGLEPGTTYYVRAYATNSQGTSYGDEVSFTTSIELPKVTTTSVSDITSKSAKSGGNVTSDGGSTVTERGIVWGTVANPDLSNSNKLISGNGEGSFTSSITGLTPNTKYYVRAYATNSVGTSYGEQVSFTTDAEGNTEGVGNEDFEW